MGTTEWVTIGVFALGVVLAVIGFFVRSHVKQIVDESKEHGQQISNLRDFHLVEIRASIAETVRHHELESFRAETRSMVDGLRGAIKADLDAMRRGEIKELHELLREETRLTRQEMRQELNQSMGAIREELVAIRQNQSRA